MGVSVRLEFWEIVGMWFCVKYFFDFKLGCWFFLRLCDWEIRIREDRIFRRFLNLFCIFRVLGFDIRGFFCLLGYVLFFKFLYNF